MQHIVEPEPFSKWLDLLSLFCKTTSTVAAADAPLNFTVFHSSALPSISLSDYITRLDRHTEAGAECIALCFVLIGRYTRCTGKNISLLSMHRLFITALRVVTKMQHDQFRSNRTFARYGGVRIDELCRLEAHLLHCVKFEVFFRQDDLDYTMAFLNEAMQAESDTARVNSIAAALQVNSPYALINFEVSSRDVTPSAGSVLLSADARVRRVSTPGESMLSQHLPSVHTMSDLVVASTPSTASMFLSLNPNISATSVNAFVDDSSLQLQQLCGSTAVTSAVGTTLQPPPAAIAVACVTHKAVAVADHDEAPFTTVPPSEDNLEGTRSSATTTTAGSGIAMVRALRTQSQ